MIRYSVKAVIEFVEFLKFKEKQKRWEYINESEAEYINESEMSEIQRLKSEGTYISQEELLKELGINECEIYD